jgi:hypothetical protein
MPHKLPKKVRRAALFLVAENQEGLLKVIDHLNLPTQNEADGRPQDLG